MDVVYAIIIGSGLLFVLLFRYVFVQKEMKRMTRELERIRTKGTDERLQIKLGNRTTERLAVEINALMDEKQEVRGGAIRREKELTEMITSMSHDLRTPLTAIIGYVQLLDKPEITLEEHTRYTSIVYGRASQLQALIQSFFALSAIQSGQEVLQMKKIDLKEMVKNTVLSYYDMFQENQKKVVFDLPKEKCFIIGDRTACKRIIENIVLNALQHSTKDVEVIVELRNEEISFSVRNAIRPDASLDERRLFDRLYTGDSTRKYHRGLGLPIVDRLMNQMHGQVEAQVKGGVFTICCTWKK